MNTAENNTFLNYTAATLPPAQLWVGKHEHLIAEIEKFLQILLCQHKGCQTCTTCIHIRDKQHHSVLWLYPEKTYTIEHFDPLFSTIAFQLQQNELFFFIIQKADYLSTTCANKLLKSMEEPPRGYHFILLAERTEQILPTIISRCTIHTLSTRSYLSEHPIVQSLTNLTTPITEFSKILDTTTTNEQESIKLLDEIFNYWITQYKETSINTTNNTTRITTLISLLKNTYTQLPMPGSTTLFWRNLYLKMHNKNFSL
jgi:DNA polymerase III gamma/tau subunit